MLTSHSVIDPQYDDYYYQSGGYQQDYSGSDTGNIMDYHGSYYGQYHDPYSGYQYSSDHRRSRYGQYEQCYETSCDDYHYSTFDVQGHGHQHDHDVSPVQHFPPFQLEYGLRHRHDVHQHGPRYKQDHDVSPVQHSSLPVM